MGIERAETIARMRKAFRAGLSAGAFFRQERTAERPLYRRTDMLRDWASVNQLERKKDLLKYVRKDRYPTAKTIASVAWDMSKEFMYVVKVKTQQTPDVPVLEHNINILSDVPMTPEMIEEMVIEERAREEKYFGEILLEVQPWTAVRRVLE